MEKTYIKKLEDLKAVASKMNTPMGVFLKTFHLILLVNRYENNIEFNKNLNDHPYILTEELIDQAQAAMRQAGELAFLEDPESEYRFEHFSNKEELHEKLFNNLWKRYEAEAMEEYISRYYHRVDVNSLPELVKGKRCIDLGCGNGAFLFAMLKAGAKNVVGVDFGKESIAHAEKYAKEKGISDSCEFVATSVYELPYDEESFDFAIQNGVFHHLNEEDKAIEEVTRILKKGGYFWFYNNGEGAIKADLLNIAVEILKDVPEEYIVGMMKNMNIKEQKINYLTDGFKAVYAFTTYDELTDKLARFGYGNFKRMVGGFQTDFDYDCIEADPYGKEKYGEGNLRILAKKIN